MALLDIICRPFLELLVLLILFYPHTPLHICTLDAGMERWVGVLPCSLSLTPKQKPQGSYMSQL